MERQVAQEILLQMLNGIDPVTGEILPEDHFLNAPEVQEALLRGIQALRPQSQQVCTPAQESSKSGQMWLRKNGKPHAGRPWTEADHQLLKSLMAQNVPVEEIARQMCRRVRGVMREMALLETGGNNRGKKWLPEQEALLRQLFTQGESIRHMAQVLNRSENAINLRLLRLGLIPGPEEMDKAESENAR